MAPSSFRALLPCGMQTAILAFSLFASGAVIAQAPSPVAEREITQMFSALQGSQCEFYRNGTWHNAQKASAHLQRKYDYLRKRGLVTSAEAFIDLAATRSSMSGKPYQVRCDKAEPMPSKSWFTRKLNELRRQSQRLETG